MSNDPRQGEINDIQAGADEIKKQIEMLKGIFSMLEKQQDKDKPGDFPTKQELNIPPVVVRNYKEISNSIVNKPSTEDVQPGQKLDDKPLPVVVEVKQDPKPTIVPGSPPNKSDLPNLMDVVQSSLKSTVKPGTQASAAIPIKPVNKPTETKPETTRQDKIYRPLPTTPISEKPLLFPNVPGAKPEFKEPTTTSKQQDANKVTDSVLNLVSTIKTVLVPSLQKKDGPVSSKTTLEDKTRTASTPAPAQPKPVLVPDKPLQPPVQPTLHSQIVSVKSPIPPSSKVALDGSSRVVLNPPLLRSPDTGVRISDPLPPPNSPDIANLASKLKNFGVDPDLLGMAVKGRGMPDFNKFSDVKSQTGVDKFGFGGKFSAFKDVAVDVGNKAKTTFEAERFGDIGAGMFDMAASAVKMIPGGSFAEPVLKFGKALMSSIETVRKWADNLHNANMSFAEFSASMAKVEAESEARRIRLSQERGERRSDSARRLAERKDSLDAKLSVWEDKWADLKAEFMIPMLDGIEGIHEAARLIKEYIYGKDKDEKPITGINLADLARLIVERGEAFEQFGRPARFPRLPGDRK